MKKLFKVISILLVVCLVFPMAAFGTELQDNSNVTSARLARIERLNEERDDLYMAILTDESLRDDPKMIAMLEANKQELIKEGVRFLTWEEVVEENPYMLNYAEQLGEPNMPDSSSKSSDDEYYNDGYNEWQTIDEPYPPEGDEVYDIHMVICSPISTASSLWKNGSMTSSVNVNSTIGNSVIFYADASLNDTAFGYSEGNLDYSLYSALKSAVPTLQTSTEVIIPEISYSVSNRVTVCFFSAREHGDIYLTPVGVVTKARTNISYQIPTLRYRNPSGAMVTHGSSISGTKIMEPTPYCYDNRDTVIGWFNTYLGTNYVQVGVDSVSVYDLRHNRNVSFSLSIPGSTDWVFVD